jgi:hypothetical protein
MPRPVTTAKPMSDFAHALAAHAAVQDFLAAMERREL